MESLREREQPVTMPAAPDSRVTADSGNGIRMESER